MNNILQMIAEYAKKEGIDLEEVEYEVKKPKASTEQKKEKSIELIKKYETITGQWLKNQKDQLEVRQKEWQDLLEIGVESVIEKSKEVQDALEVIQWYFYFIRAKVVRAFNGKDNKWMKISSPVQNDMNGSAKVAFIAVENSLAAWETIRKHFSELEGEILEVMIVLSKIRKDINHNFPKNQKIIRPGFDEVD